MKTFEKSFKNYDLYLNCFGLSLHTIEIKPITESGFQLKHADNTINIEKEDIALTVQKARDKINISGKSYLHLKKVFTKIPNVRLPGLTRVEQIKLKMNKFFEVIQSESGAFVNVQEKIQFIRQAEVITQNTRIPKIIIILKIIIIFNLFEVFV